MQRRLERDDQVLVTIYETLKKKSSPNISENNIIWRNTKSEPVIHTIFQPGFGDVRRGSESGEVGWKAGYYSFLSMATITIRKFNRTRHCLKSDDD